MTLRITPYSEKKYHDVIATLKEVFCPPELGPYCHEVNTYPQKKTVLHHNTPTARTYGTYSVLFVEVLDLQEVQRAFPVMRDPQNLGRHLYRVPLHSGDLVRRVLLKAPAGHPACFAYSGIVVDAKAALEDFLRIADQHTGHGAVYYPQQACVSVLFPVDQNTVVMHLGIRFYVPL
jgi:hypothetical protein